MPALQFAAAPAPVPWHLPWATGRFYSNPYLPGTSTAAWGNGHVRGCAFYVPNLAGVTVTSIGIDVTGGATAGKLLRFGIYSMLASGAPGVLLLDGGTTAADSTGFRSVTVSKFLRQGWYWVAGLHDSTVTAPTVRAFSNISPVCDPVGVGYPGDTTFQQQAASVQLTSTVDYVANGMPGAFSVIPVNGGTFTYPQNGGVVPRIMIGV